MCWPQSEARQRPVGYMSFVDVGVPRIFESPEHYTKSLTRFVRASGLDTSSRTASRTDGSLSLAMRDI